MSLEDGARAAVSPGRSIEEGPVRGRALLWCVPAVVLPALLALPLLAGQTLLFRDILHFVVPQQAFAAGALASGRLPLWNPLLLGGVPFLAEPGSGVFYPPNALFLLLEPATAASAFVLLHLALAGAGAHWLARVLGSSPAPAACAGSAFLGSGYLLSMHGGHYYLAGAAWVPLACALLLRAAERPSAVRIAAGAGAVALMIFNGELQAVAFACGLGALLALGWRRQARALVPVVGASLLAALLAAVQLLPTLSFAGQTIRAGGVPLEFATRWSLHPVRWLEFALPEPFGASYPDNLFWGGQLVGMPGRAPWAPSLYLGAAAVVLALGWGWRGRTGWEKVALGVAGGALLVAAGKFLPLFAWWWRLVPLADRFRYPEKYALLATLALALLAAAGIQWMLQHRPSPRLPAAVAVLLSLLAAVVLWRPPGALVEAARQGVAFAASSASTETAMEGLAVALLHGGLALGGLALCAWLARRRPSAAAALLVSLTAFEALSSGMRLLSYGDARFLSAPAPPLAEALRARIDPRTAGRVLFERGCVPADTGGEGTRLERQRAWEWASGKENFFQVLGIPSALGYSAAIPSDKQAVVKQLGTDQGERVARRFGAALRVVCPRPGQLEIVPVRDPLPRAFLVSDALAASFPLEGSGEPPSALAPLGVRDETPERVRVRTEAAGTLVLSDSFAQGWTAFVDGSPAAILRAYGLWRGVRVPAGAHEVLFVYRAPGLAGGALLSGLTALALALAIGREGWRRRVA